MLDIPPTSGGLGTPHWFSLSPGSPEEEILCYFFRLRRWPVYKISVTTGI
jgi:hypothetical protein